MMWCWIVGRTYWPKTDPFAPFNIHWGTRTIKETKWQFWTFKKNVFGQGLLTLTEKGKKEQGKSICEV